MTTETAGERRLIDDYKTASTEELGVRDFTLAAILEEEADNLAGDVGNPFACLHCVILMVAAAHARHRGITRAEDFPGPVSFVLGVKRPGLNPGGEGGVTARLIDRFDTASPEDLVAEDFTLAAMLEEEADNLAGDAGNPFVFLHWRLLVAAAAHARLHGITKAEDFPGPEPFAFDGTVRAMSLKDESLTGEGGGLVQPE